MKQIMKSRIAHRILASSYERFNLFSPVAVYWGDDEFYVGVIKEYDRDKVVIKMNFGELETVEKENFDQVIPLRTKLSGNFAYSKKDIANARRIFPPAGFSEKSKEFQDGFYAATKRTMFEANDRWASKRYDDYEAGFNLGVKLMGFKNFDEYTKADSKPSSKQPEKLKSTDITPPYSLEDAISKDGNFWKSKKDDVKMREYRRKVLDIEDVVYDAIDNNNYSVFSPFSELFPNLDKYVKRSIQITWG